VKLNFETSSPRLLAGAVLVGLIAMAPGSAIAEDAAPQATAVSPEAAEHDQDTTSANQPTLQAGRVVHIDPQTGRKTLPTQAQRVAGQAHLGSMINRSSAGLIETASPSSGVMVNLLGRFRHATVLTVNESGDVASECSATIPAEPVLSTAEVNDD
jgi:hypothetical protein